MRTIQEWMRLYSRDHKHPTNQLIHKICVPAIMFTVLGLLWEIPRISLFGNLVWVNWGTLFSLGVLGFYFQLSRQLAIGMTLVVVLMFSLIYLIDILSPVPLYQIMIVVFVVSWIFQFIGHKIEGQKPSFLEDVAFLLIGPLWVMVSFYRKLGIRYT
jgi:uncharacterized membrane protein YGL010W